MNEKKFLYGILGLFVGMLLIWVIAALAVNNRNVGMMNMMGFRSGSQTMSDNVDKHFIEQMVPHHEDAIIMANIALQKAEHQEIKNLSQDIARTQTEENNQMKQWYESWFGEEVPETFAGMGRGMGSGMMHGGMMGNSSDISDLEKAQPFDKEFIEQMIPHHQMAIMMAQMLKGSTTRTEMKQLADNIIDAQTREIQQMRSWYSQWYNN